MNIYSSLLNRNILSITAEDLAITDISTGEVHVIGIKPDHNLTKNVTTDDLPEGIINKYFDQDIVYNQFSAGANLAYNGTGQFSLLTDLTGISTAEIGNVSADDAQITNMVNTNANIVNLFITTLTSTNSTLTTADIATLTSTNSTLTTADIATLTSTNSTLTTADIATLTSTNSTFIDSTTTRSKNYELLPYTSDSTPLINTTLIRGNTDLNNFLRFRKGGASPLGRAGILFSSYDTSHFSIDNDSNILKIGFSANSTLDTTLFSDLIHIRSDGAIRASDGTSSLPSYSFISDPNTGMFLNSSNELMFSILGSDKLSIQGSKIESYTNLTTQSLSIGSMNYPTVDGASSQVISTDGAGSLYWQSIAGLSNIYTSNGTLTSNRTLSQGGYDLVFDGMQRSSQGLVIGSSLFTGTRSQLGSYFTHIFDSPYYLSCYKDSSPQLIFRIGNLNQSATANKFVINRNEILSYEPLNMKNNNITDILSLDTANTNLIVKAQGSNAITTNQNLTVVHGDVTHELRSYFYFNAQIQLTGSVKLSGKYSFMNIGAPEPGADPVYSIRFGNQTPNPATNKGEAMRGFTLSNSKISPSVTRLYSIDCSFSLYADNLGGNVTPILRLIQVGVTTPLFETRSGLFTTDETGHTVSLKIVATLESTEEYYFSYYLSGANYDSGRYDSTASCIILPL